MGQRGDAEGSEDAGAEGHPWLQIPNFDRLCKQSVRMTDFMVSPTYGPHRAHWAGNRFVEEAGRLLEQADQKGLPGVKDHGLEEKIGDWRRVKREAG